MSIILESLERAIEEAASGNPSFKITLSDKQEPSKWLQLSWDSLNFAYPEVEPPSVILRRCHIHTPPYVEVSEWEPGRFVTFSHGAEPLEQLAEFAEAIFTLVVHGDPTSGVISEHE